MATPNETKALHNQSGVSSIFGLIINLEDRVDRRDSAASQITQISFPVEFISAIPASIISNEEASYLPKAAVACWKSHKRAYETLLKSNHTHAVVIEDDFKILDLKKIELILESIRGYEIDLLQLGFLNKGIRQRIHTISANIETSAFKVLALVSKWPILNATNLENRLRVRRASECLPGIVPDDFRSGAHFYLISRNMASEILKFNNPVFLTADNLLEASVWSQRFKAYRVKKSLVDQSTSISSIKGKA